MLTVVARRQDARSDNLSRFGHWIDATALRVEREKLAGAIAQRAAVLDMLDGRAKRFGCYIVLSAADYQPAVLVLGVTTYSPDAIGQAASHDPDWFDHDSPGHPRARSARLIRSTASPDEIMPGVTAMTTHPSIWASADLSESDSKPCA